MNVSEDTLISLTELSTLLHKRMISNGYATEVMNIVVSYCSHREHFCDGCKHLPVHTKSIYCREDIKFRAKTSHSQCKYKRGKNAQFQRNV